jgi:dolichol-phosphate mannosyltransferase
MSLSIVIPVYNEAGNINLLLKKIAQALVGIKYEIIFVDDSTDETPMVIQHEAQQNNINIVIEHRENQKGLATAVLRGFELATGDFIAVMDADLQHPPEILRGMYCAMLYGADICIPSRFIPGGSDGGLDCYRKMVSLGARSIGKCAIHNLKYISDPTSGLFMLRRQMLEGVKLNPVGWKIGVEILAMCPYNKVIEIPYVFQRRNNGKSKLSTKVSIEYLKQLYMLMPVTKKNKTIHVSRWSKSKLDEKLNQLENEECVLYAKG